ncbi:Tn3 family transposase [Chloroflexia bacterium SDU3-3]|nr:Tn3 family transposase [Chloroflexia bacterium SDU3-3]
MSAILICQTSPLHQGYPRMPSIERTAYPFYRRTLPPSDMHRYYTLTPEEHAWVLQVARGPTRLVACSVLLKAAQHLGYFPLLTEIPSRIIQHVVQAWDIFTPIALHTITDRTLYTYHRHIRAFLGRSSDDRMIRRAATTALVAAAQVHDSPVDLINATVETLRTANVELPAFSTLDRLTRRVRTLVNARLAQRLAAQIPAEHQHAVLDLLAPIPGQITTRLAEVKQGAQQASFQHFAALLTQLQWLDSLGDFTLVLADVPPSKIQHLAAEAKALDAMEIRKMRPAKQLLLLVCLIHRMQAQIRDAIIEMFRKRMHTFHTRARTQLEQLQLAHQAEIQRMLTTFTAMLEVLDEQPTPTEAMDRLAAIMDPVGGTTALLHSCEQLAAWTGNTHLPLIWQCYHTHRRLFFRMLDSLTFTATNQDTSLLAALTWLKDQRNRTAAHLPATLDLSFVPDQWQRIILTRIDQKPMLIRKPFEVCIFTCLAAELKAGDMAVARSDAYTDYRAQLLPWEVCAPQVAAYSQQIGFPPTAGGFVADLRARLEHAAQLVDAAFPDNHDLTITATGEPILKRLARPIVAPQAAALETELLARMPERQLLDIMATVAHWTNCTRHFAPSSGSDPKLSDPQRDYTHLLFAYGTNMGPVQAARHMGEAMSAHRLSYLNRRHVTSAALHAAASDIINVYRPLTLPRAWGDGSRVAADGTMIELMENNPLAEYHFRYRMRGGVAYHHVADTYVAIFSHFIPCGVWEAVYLIEGLLQNTSDLRPTKVHADTQGQSTPVFALAHLLGIELLPRIRNWKDLIFFKATREQTFQHLEPLFQGVIDWDLIERHWQDLLQVVLSIQAGKISSAMVLRKLGNDSKKNKLYQVFRELGRVIRTLFLLRYISDQSLRVEITATTNKVEAFNGFQQWLTFGREGSIPDGDPEEAEKRVNYADVLANAVILHNVYDMTTALKAMLDDGYPVEWADLATLSPYITRHIQRFGAYQLSPEPPPPFEAVLSWALPNTNP